MHCMQYLLKWRKDAINNMIEKAILEANKKGVKVLSLGLMNQVIWFYIGVRCHFVILKLWWVGTGGGAKQERRGVYSQASRNESKSGGRQ